MASKGGFSDFNSTCYKLSRNLGGELKDDSAVSILEITVNDGTNYKTKFYYLDTFLQFNLKY